MKIVKNNSITLISPFLGPVLFGGTDEGGGGGAERQVTLIGKGLVERGVDVNFICMPVIRTEQLTVPLAKIHFVPFRYLGGNKIYWLIDGLKLLRKCISLKSDYYLLRSGGYLISSWLYIGQIFFGMKIISSTQHDRDVNPKLSYDKKAQGENAFLRSIHRFTVRHATIIFAQTKQQCKYIKEYLLRDSLIVPNMASPLWAGGETSVTGSNYILWAGNPSKNKRVEVVFELAKLLPHLNFVVGMNTGDEQRIEMAAEFSRTHLNFNFLGNVSPTVMEELYKKAAIVLNTSKLEGFPNTFLQAWESGVPVFTAGIDPDSVIVKNDLGKVVKIKNLEADKIAELAKEINDYFEDPTKAIEYSTRCRAYVEKYHSIDAISDAIYSYLFKK